jgi:hypothetical protein
LQDSTNCLGKKCSDCLAQRYIEPVMKTRHRRDVS